MESYPLDLKYVVDPERDERIADELTALRERGLEHLYAPTGGQETKEFPELQPRADAFCRALHLPAFGPTATMSALLKAGVSAYARWGNGSQSRELFNLFFDPKGTPRRSAGQRLNAARKEAQLDDKRFYQYQHILFRDFAPFLDAFVTATIHQAAAQLPPPDQDQARAEDHAGAGRTADHARAATPPEPGSRLSAALALLLAAGLVATVLVLAVLSRGSRQSPEQAVAHSAAPVTITGYVKCLPDATKRVVGVYVEGATGGSGWAGWHALPGQPNVAWFSRTLPNGSSYTVHVGCGGTPQHWELAITSLTGVQGSGHTFTCYDAPSVKDPTQVSCRP